MSLRQFIRPECVAIQQVAADKESVLRRIAELATLSPALSEIDSKKIFAALRDREKIGSTGFHDGVAIPHCRLADVKAFTVGLLAAPDGVDFESSDGGRSDLLFFIVGPESEREIHIRLLSTISRVCAAKDNRAALLRQDDSRNLYDVLVSRLPAETEPEAVSKSCFFTIAVQREEIFNEVLEEVAALTSTISVVEARDAGDFLHSLPLFSTFWDEGSRRFHRLIMGSLNRQLVNELIRGIDLRCGGLDQNAGVSVAVNDSLVVAGSLNA